MKILAIDTSSSNCSTAIIEDEKIISNFDLNIGCTHSETLLPLIDTVQKFSKINIDDIDVLSCTIGPGSFTGLRIGLSTLKGIAMSLDKKVIGIPTLESLAYNVSYFDGIICSVLDAKNDNVYAANYRYTNKPIMEGEYISDSIEMLISELKKFNSKILFIGDGSISYRERFINEFGNNAVFAPFHLNTQLSISTAKAALDKAYMGLYDDYDKLAPMYLKKSQAERTLGIDA